MNTPTIETKRLILRKFNENDVEDLFELLRDEEVNKFLPMFPLKTIEEAQEFLNEKYLKSYEKPSGFNYALCLRHDNKVIGYVNLNDDDSHDLGYGLRKEFWNKGIMTEAVSSVVEKLKCYGISYITATHDINNKQSGRVMQKIGMVYQYSYREMWQPKNILVTFRMYQLNFEEHDVYKKYWNKYEDHFIEKDV